MKHLICVLCPKGCRLQVDEMNGCAVAGNACPRGESYGRGEVLHPVRVVTSTVRVEGGALRRCPVKTKEPVPKALVLAAVKALNAITLPAPVESGQEMCVEVAGEAVIFTAPRGIDAARDSAESRPVLRREGGEGARASAGKAISGSSTGNN